HIPYIPHHNIDAYRKSDIRKCKELFAEDVARTVNNHFRSEDDLQRVVVLYYLLAIKEGELRLMGRYNRSVSLMDKLNSTLRSRYSYDSRRIAITVGDIRAVLKKYNPTLYCLNDGEDADEECRQRVRTFLEQEFPLKSSFEL
ncbi:MAG: glycosyltransferase, partial [Bacteroidaceae bacterium]|nr:glycosyltransferase [Bacteroidaceae bacterium]